MSLWEAGHGGYDTLEANTTAYVAAVLRHNALLFEHAIPTAQGEASHWDFIGIDPASPPPYCRRERG